MGEGGIDKGDSDWIGSDIELEGINSIERIGLVVGSVEMLVEVPMKSVLVSVGILGEGGVINGWIGGKDESEARIEVGLFEAQWGKIKSSRWEAEGWE